MYYEKKLCLILSLSLTLCYITPTIVKAKEINPKTEISQTKESIVEQQDKYYRIEAIDSVKPILNENVKTKTTEITKEQFNYELLNHELNKIKPMNNARGLGPGQATGDSTSTSWVYMSTTVYHEQGNRYKLRNYISWSTVPNFATVDVISVHANSGFSPINESRTFSQSYRVNFAGNYNYFNDSYPDKGYEWLDRGSAAKFTLGGGYAGSAENVKVDFSVAGYINQTDWMNVYGNYVHQEKRVGITPSVSISGANVVLSPQTATDKAPNTNVQFQPQN